MQKFNEDSRVKIPVLLQLTRLGYAFLPKSSMHSVDAQTCIFKDLFKSSLSRINKKDYSDRDIDDFLS